MDGGKKVVLEDHGLECRVQSVGHGVQASLDAGDGQVDVVAGALVGADGPGLSGQDQHRGPEEAEWLHLNDWRWSSLTIQT